jgi:hypothetical protein
MPVLHERAGAAYGGHNHIRINAGGFSALHADRSNRPQLRGDSLFAGRSVTEPCLHLLHAEPFLAALAEFERTRRGTASLNGTCDFRLNIRPHGPTGAAWVGFYLAEYLWLKDNSHGRHALEGGLVVPGESVGQLLRDFQQLLARRRT